MDQTAGARPPADPPPADHPAAERAPRRRWWLGTLIFIGGVVAGVLGSGLLVATTPEFGAPAAPAGSPSASPINPVEVTAQAQVNAACLRVINDAQDVYQILTGVGDAASELDFQRLDDIVRRLQPIEPRLARNLRDCRVDTSFTGAPPPGGQPPSSEPTPGSATTPGPAEPSNSAPGPGEPSATTGLR